MVTAMLVLFLIATVVFALSQMLNVSSGNVIDGERQSDSTAAFFLAESGLERGQAALTSALVTTVTNAACTGIAGNTSLGRGTVAVTGTSNPPSCSGSACLDCTVRAVGQVGISTRTVERQVALTTQNGTFCNGPVTNNCRNSPTVTWQLNLVNTSIYDGVAMFNLAYTAKGSNGTTCAVASNCRLQFDLGSPSSGQNSAGIMGNSVNIPAGASYPIYQVMDRADRALVEVGVIFKGQTAAPTLTGTVPTLPAHTGRASYWNTGNGGTIGHPVDTTGTTNDGTATAPGACTSNASNASQSCTDWCYGGDTLVFSYAAKVGSLADGLSNVNFGTGTGGTQNVPMLPMTKYPTPLISGAPTDVEAEIWYASNPNLTGSSPLAVNASSYKGRGIGAYGATWSGTGTSKVDNGAGAAGNILTVGNQFTTYPSQIVTPGIVGVGDLLRSSGGSGNVDCTGACPTILTQVTSAEPHGALGGRGTYTISGTAQSVSSSNPRIWTVSSKVLNVSSCTTCFFEANDPLSAPVGGRTVTAQQTPLGTVLTRGRVEFTAGVGRYTTTPATFVQAGPGAIVQAGTPGTTVYVPFTSNLPALTTPAMRLAVKTGTGVLANNTTVTAVSAAGVPNAVTRSFVLNATPTTALDDVSLCAGTCAFFVAGVAGTTTTFTIAKSVGTQEWASAFTCLKGVNVLPETVTSSSSASNRWTEVIY